MKSIKQGVKLHIEVITGKVAKLFKNIPIKAISLPTANQYTAGLLLGLTLLGLGFWLSGGIPGNAGLTAYAKAQQPGESAGSADVSKESTSSTTRYRRFRASHGAMGTEFVVVAYLPCDEMDGAMFSALTQDIFEQVDMLESHISNWREDSDIAALNRAAGSHAVSVHRDVLELLRYAGDIYKRTNGAFDVTVGPLLDLWGFYRKEGEFPAPEALEAARRRVGFSAVSWDMEAGTAKLDHPEMNIDFGGIGKGMAVDRMANMLRSNNVHRAAIHSGSSSMRLLDAPPNSAGWTVRIRHPYNEVDEPIDTIELVNASISTSAGYENWVELDGKKYSHIFDPRTGLPVEGILSTSAIAATGVESDALSTAFYVMGLDKTKAYCAEHADTRAIVVVERNGEVVPVRINMPKTLP